MPGFLRTRLLPGAPRWWLALVVVTAVGGLLTGTGRTGSQGQSAISGPLEIVLVMAPHVGLSQS
jgi:hypothetical protein